MDTKQTMFFSDKELELMKQTFGGESPILYALRNLFLQFNLTKEEEKALEFSVEKLNLLEKLFLPDLDKEIPIFQQRTMCGSLYKIKDFNFEPAMLHIYANDLLIDYIKQQLKNLKGDKEELIILKKLALPMGCDQEELRYINILAYQNIIIYVEGRINELRTLANPQKQETEDEKKKREQANSAK